MGLSVERAEASPERARRQERVAGLAARIERWLPALVVAVAFFLRLIRLDLYPQGLLFDEAFNGLDAASVLHGYFPIVFPGNRGREALFMYLESVSIAGFGQTTFAARLPAALAGALTVPLGYLLIRRMFGRRVALLASAWLAVSLWQVIVSRLAFSTILLSFFAALTFYLLWRALESAWAPNAPTSGQPLTAGLGWFVAAGLSLGLSLYTYIPARFFPFVPLLFGLYLAIFNRARFRTALPGLAVTGVIAALVFLPEGLFFYHNPYYFFQRADEVSVLNPALTGGGPLRPLAEAALAYLGMFALRGDTDWVHNVSGLPMFDPLSALFFLAGVVLVLRRPREPGHAFLLIWMAAMLAPAVIAFQSAPNYLRITGAVPAIYVFPAIAAACLWDRLQRRLGSSAALAGALVVLAGLVIAGVATYRSYVAWAREPSVADVFLASRWLTMEDGRTLARQGPAPVYLGAGDVDAIQQGYTLQGPNQALGVWMFDGRRSLIFPPGSAGATYLFPAEDLPDPSLRQRFFAEPRGRLLDRTVSGDPIYAFQLLAPRPPIAPEWPVAARFADKIEVEGYDLPKEAKAGETIAVRWYWKILAPDQRELAFTNQILDDHGTKAGQLDDRSFSPGYTPGYWPNGTSGISIYPVQLRADAAPGTYWLHVGVYDRRTLTRLSVLDPRGNQAGDQIVIGPITIRCTAGD